jgi:hypothetical protein
MRARTIGEMIEPRNVRQGTSYNKRESERRIRELVERLGIENPVTVRHVDPETLRKAA